MAAARIATLLLIAACASNPPNEGCVRSDECPGASLCINGECVTPSLDGGARDAPADGPSDEDAGATCGEPCETDAPCELGVVDCSGATPRCVGAGPKPAGEACRDAMDACDAADACDGVSLGCSDAKADVGTECPGGFCDGAGACGECTPGTMCPISACEIGEIRCSPAGEPSCERVGDAPEGTSCGDVVEGAFGPCETRATCDRMGEQRRDVERPVCRSGECVVESTTELRACDRDPSGESCGPSMPGPWGTCSAASTCATTGMQSRTVVDRRCDSGACADVTRMEMQSCSRVTNGNSCGADAPGPWGECAFTGCSLSGTQTRTVSEPRCSGGSCASTSRTETRACSRPTSEGAECGPTVFGEFGETCLYTDCDPDMGVRFRSAMRRVCSATNVCMDMNGFDSESCPPGGDVVGSFCSPGAGGFGSCAGPFNCRPSSPF